MKVGRYSLIHGLSYALDILGKNNLSHSKSASYLSVCISREIGMNEENTRNIYYAALLHDIGVDDEFIRKNRYDAESMKRHCSMGCDIIKKLPLPGDIAEYLLYHHEYSDGSGAFGMLEKDIPLGGQIICFTSAFDDLFSKIDNYDFGVFLKIEKWLDRSTLLFSREITDAFSKLIQKEMFLLDYFNHETKYTLPERINIPDDICYDTDDIKRFAYCFADIVDQRSQFTFHHSIGIAELAQSASVSLGYDSETQSKMYIAGLLHDIGKLHISTDILHKNGPLTREERFEMNKHTYFTRKILEQIGGFEEIVDIAANHHEKLDGTGYPVQIQGEDMGELERVMAICDVFQALTEERPYRAKMPVGKALEIISGLTDKQHLDGVLFGKIKQVLGDYIISISAWSNDYISGFSDIDIQHKEFFKMIYGFTADNNAGKTSQNMLLELLDNLKISCETHFMLEEKIMEENQYPLTGHHKSAHEKLSGIIIETTGKIKTDDPEIFRKKIVEFCSEYLSLHIIREDLAFISFYKNKYYNLGAHFAGKNCVISNMNGDVLGEGRIESVNCSDVVIENKGSLKIPADINDILKISSFFEDHESQTFVAKVYYSDRKAIKLFSATIIPSVNNRKHFRVPVRIEAEAHFSKETSPVVIADISAGGMMLEMRQNFEAGEVINVEFTINNSRVNTPCKIMRAEKNADAPNVYGVKFMSLKKADADNIHLFIFNRQILDKKNHNR
ncbi:MAG: HD domain-containing protein [Oscillospiraceae bacterium]|nr:HD domain-containing protein [Oscillospiraceae bacterium]